MLNLKTDVLELRGLVNQTSKKGNVYYVVYCESAQGEPYKFFCRDAKAFAEGLKKGDSVVVTLTYNSFKELQVVAVEKVGA